MHPNTNDEYIMLLNCTLWLTETLEVGQRTHTAKWMTRTLILRAITYIIGQKQINIKHHKHQQNISLSSQHPDFTSYSNHHSTTDCFLQKPIVPAQNSMHLCPTMSYLAHLQCAQLKEWLTCSSVMGLNTHIAGHYRDAYDRITANGSILSLLCAR